MFQARAAGGRQTRIIRCYQIKSNPIENASCVLLSTERQQPPGAGGSADVPHLPLWSRRRRCSLLRFRSRSRSRPPAPPSPSPSSPPPSRGREWERLPAAGGFQTAPRTHAARAEDRLIAARVPPKQRPWPILRRERGTGLGRVDPSLNDTKPGSDQEPPNQRDAPNTHAQTTTPARMARL